MFNYTFMQNAWIVGTLISIISAMMGVFIVAKRMSFFGHILSEISFSGASFGLFMSWSPLLGILLFTSISAISIGKLGINERRSESLISAVSAVAIGMGIAFLSLSDKSASSATGILFGSIFSISDENIWQVIILSLVVLIFMMILYRSLKHFSFDYDTAKYSLHNKDKLEIVFLLMISITVTISSQVVGSLLVFILLVLPASSAMRWGRTVFQMIGLAILFSLVGVWSGLTLAYFTNLPFSFYISLIESCIYFLSLFLIN